jgi:hypothetical protein
MDRAGEIHGLVSPARLALPESDLRWTGVQVCYESVYLAINS